MATGHLYDFMVPESVKFELTGTLPKGVFSKDIILHIIGVMGAGGCSKRVAEFTGPGYAACQWTPALPSVTWPSR